MNKFIDMIKNVIYTSKENNRFIHMPDVMHAKKD